MKELLDIAIVGKGGFGREVRFLIEDINRVEETYRFIGFFDDDKSEPIDGSPYLGNISSIHSWDKPLAIAIAIGNSQLREKIQLSIDNNYILYPNLIHPNVLFDEKHCTFGVGNIFCASSILTTNIKISNFMILNLGCTIGHDVVIEDFCSVMPSVNISGGITIGRNCFIGTGVKIINDKKIGDNVVLGAGAIVIKDIPNNAVAVGNPAKVIKINE